MTTLKKLIDFLTPQERSKLWLLMGMIVVMALLDVLGVASIMPFMAVAADPNLVETNALLSSLYREFDFGNMQQFLLFLGFIVFALLVLSLTFKALTTYVQTRFGLMCEYSIGRRLIAGYLHQPYTWFLNRHSADLGKAILSEVGTVVHTGILPMMNLIGQSAVAIALLVALLLVDPKLALMVGVVLGIIYGLVFRGMSGFLSRIGRERVKANQDRFVAVNEAFAAAKEVKLGGLEYAYTQRFAVPAEVFAKHLASAQVVAQAPRYLIEAFAFGGMLLVVLYLMAQSNGFAGALPILALYAFAGYRLMPALQQIYNSFTSLQFVVPAVNALHKDFESLAPYEQTQSVTESIRLTEAITLDDVTFSYPNSEKNALSGLNLVIPARTSVGLVGSTGSGKTTTVDLILGLLEAQSGSLLVDGKIIDASNRRAWQRSIGYVPQQIYLADDTVAANIAFGVPVDCIDWISIERAAKIANLHDFVVAELSQGYLTTIGERGVRLSGGQRQRIGIARALYHNPQVLIMDEATSALDNLTEQVVMEAVNNLGHDITIILIAHRLSTVKQCDQIYLLEKGRIKANGTYKELSATNDIFKQMTGLAT